MLTSRVCPGVQAKEVLSALVEAEHHVGTLNPYYMDTVNKARSQVEQAAKAPPPSSSYRTASTTGAGARSDAALPRRLRRQVGPGAEGRHGVERAAGERDWA